MVKGLDSGPNSAFPSPTKHTVNQGNRGEPLQELYTSEGMMITGFRDGTVLAREDIGEETKDHKIPGEGGMLSYFHCCCYLLRIGVYV